MVAVAASKGFKGGITGNMGGVPNCSSGINRDTDEEGFLPEIL